MVFLQEDKARHVWKDKVIATFENGQFETEDDEVIKHLLKLGYKTENGDEIVIYDAEEIEEEKEEKEELHLEKMSIRQLREFCKKEKYEGYSNLSKVKLLEFIKERK